MRRRAFLLDGARAAAGVALLPLVPSTLCAASASQIPELERVISQLMKDALVPGVAIAVIRDAKLVWRQEFGVKDSASRVPVDDRTVFEAASVSKTVFAYAAMKLCEKGVIGLDTPLSRYTKTRFLEGDSRLEKITPRHLLSHSAGFAEWRSNDGPLIRSEPGSTFQYSGEGYYYLQSVMTALTGTVDPTQCATYEADFEVCATDFAD